MGKIFDTMIPILQKPSKMFLNMYWFWTIPMKRPIQTANYMLRSVYTEYRVLRIMDERLFDI